MQPKKHIKQKNVLSIFTTAFTTKLQIFKVKTVNFFFFFFGENLYFFYVFDQHQVDIFFNSLEHKSTSLILLAFSNDWNMKDLLKRDSKYSI